MYKYEYFPCLNFENKFPYSRSSLLVRFMRQAYDRRDFQELHVLEEYYFLNYVFRYGYSSFRRFDLSGNYWEIHFELAGDSVTPRDAVKKLLEDQLKSEISLISIW